ncbi:MAG: hypothetical protein GF307_13130 [candidate division Zixibacteria bacterium]|nr:hypothetical protein [candidate division Zixibacteria bacterium]
MSQEKEKKKRDEAIEQGDSVVKTDKEKHEHLNEQRRIQAQAREKFKDFAREKMRKDTGIDKKRKDKHLGGVRGRRGG